MSNKAENAAAVIVVLVAVLGSLALTGAFIWALVEVVSWLVTK